MVQSESLFKMVISTTTPGTAKTISTLSNQVNLRLYSNIFILDDLANDVWCKYDMIWLKLWHKVNVMLIQVPSFDIWTSVYHRFDALPVSMHYGERASTLLYNMIATNQQIDELFVRFKYFLEKSKNGNVDDVLRQFAFSLPGQRLEDVLWKWISYIKWLK